MPKEAIQLYEKLISDHGMPECPTLMNMGHMWYETPEEVGGDSNDPVSTAVFRPLPDPVAAEKMAAYAANWLQQKNPSAGAPTGETPTERLNQIIGQL